MVYFNILSLEMLVSGTVRKEAGHKYISLGSKKIQGQLQRSLVVLFHVRTENLK